jgi:hypothetical protein
VLFLRIFQHLLPRSAAWKLTIAKPLRSFFEGLTGVFSTARTFIDGVWGDMFPETTSLRALAEFEKQFGLEPKADEAERRLELAAAWAAQGGQSPGYIQGVLRTAGHDVYVYEWWVSGPTPPILGYADPSYSARDPRDYTETPLVGTVQCSEFEENQPQCSEFAENQPQCNEFLANDPKYIVNLDLTPRPPPPIPDNPIYWRHFWYVAGTPTVDEPGYVQVSRKAEFLRLIQRLKPSQTWVVYNVIFEPALFGLLTEDDEPLVTEGDEDLLAASGS